MPRLFVAIRPPAIIRQKLVACQGGIDGARWQDDDQLHLTLRFIGAVDARTGEDILDTMQTVRAARFEIALNGVGTFERKERTEVLWAGVTPHDALASLHKKIDHALVRVGLPPEGRAYRPHITLAQFGRMAAPVTPFLATHAAMSSAPFPVSHFALFESALGSEGASYTLVERWSLG